ncbi:gamma-glutamyl-gamma-aminobutyrate hydrolase family protein [Carboxylicivirga caseinilyticus]|uniref:gamma-glutamyl-gamma-aminobutyrate hydrolase family protein n=1 Tax=Carboxylicivirga caseinilyticus TaxID=3417572 RepID=UPI003D3494B9|nr:gamma-glutamyl-gamma-aminobutyrate hydrolase family protein [Marinilabiliaceae bacterium A049]
MTFKNLALQLFAFLFSCSVLADNLPDEIKKHLLLAHPTQGTIEVMYALQKSGQVDFSTMKLSGVYHKDEAYDYSQSSKMLDTISCFKMDLIRVTDTLFLDSLYCKNKCSATFNELFTNSDGIIFFGGPDIPPAMYNEKPHPRTEVTDPYRHYFEASFLFHLLGGYQDATFKPLLDAKQDYFILGICLGMQTMNVATGGTIIQDIPSEIFNSSEKKGLSNLSNEEIHRNYYPHSTGQKKLAGSHFHRIQFKDYFFVDLLDIDATEKPQINSYHHQAVEKLGKGFKVGATSLDEKIIEGMFHSYYPNVMAVQFHPERAQFFLKTRKFQFVPNGPQKSLNKWIDEDSMEFHYKFWKAINAILNESL